MRWLGLVVLVLGLVATSLSAGPVTVVAAQGGGVCADSEEVALLQLINDYRASNGLPPYALSQALSVAADQQSQDMATNDFIGHDGTNGSTVGGRITAAGYPQASALGENVYGLNGSAQAAFDWWKSSPGHNANMLNPDFAAIGIARVNNPDRGWYWTNTFGSEVDALGCVGGEESVVAPTTEPTLEPTIEPTVALGDPGADGGEAPVIPPPVGAGETTTGVEPTAVEPTATAISLAPGCEGIDAEELALLTLINDYRATNGLPPYALSRTLSAAADRQSQDMATNDFIGHDGTDGSDVGERIAAAGYPAATALGENVYGLNGAAQAAFDWWKSSPGHNANMLNADFAAIGIARVDNPDRGWYWTNTFGSEVDAPSCVGGEETAVEPTVALGDDTAAAEETPVIPPPVVEGETATGDETPVIPPPVVEGETTTGEETPVIPPPVVEGDTTTGDEPTVIEPTATEAEPTAAEPDAPAVALAPGCEGFDAEELTLLQMINDYRASNGLPPYALSQTLSVAADRQSQDMATNDFIGHDGTDGSTVGGRIAEAGYPAASALGENVFGLDGTAAAAFGWWKTSPGHNANMLNPDFAAIGIARVNNPDRGWYWTNTFGSTVDAPICAGGEQAGIDPAAPDDDQAAVEPTATQSDVDAPAAGTPVAEANPDAAVDPACAGIDAEELALLGLINDYRAQNGVGPLVLGPTMSAAADAHSLDMATNDFLGSIGSDGSTNSQRLTEAGYAGADTAAENLFAGIETAQGAFNWWQNSGAQGPMLLNPAWVTIGIARNTNPDSTYTWYWDTTYGQTLEPGSCSGDPAAQATATAFPTATEAGFPIATGDDIPTETATSDQPAGDGSDQLPPTEESGDGSSEDGDGNTEFDPTPDPNEPATDPGAGEDADGDGFVD